MAHPHDVKCRWCGANLYRKATPAEPFRVFDHAACPLKPPLTPEEGVAACSGLIEMAKMIAARERAKPMPPDPSMRACGDRKPGDIAKCNLMVDHDGPHQRIGRNGSLRYQWAGRDRGKER